MLEITVIALSFIPNASVSENSINGAMDRKYRKGYSHSEYLRNYMDEDHHLSQKDTIEILKTEYGKTADCRAVHRNLTSLMETGYEI